MVCTSGAERNVGAKALMEEREMQSSKRNLWMLGLALLVALLAGCSSKETRPESGEIEATLTQGDDDLPNADEVGSIPEDNPDALNELADSNAAAGADPFADLEDNLAKEDQPSIEGGGGSGEMRVYNVRRGDTLMKIAFKLYGDIDRWKDLKNWNQGTIARANAIEPGTALNYVDEGEFSLEKHDHAYQIKTGDTLGGIAKWVYGKVTKWKKLQQYNARLIKDANRIFAGFTLYYNVTPEEEQEAAAMRSQIGSSGGGSAPVSAESPSGAAPTAAAPPAVPADMQAPAEPVASAPGGEAVNQ